MELTLSEVATDNRFDLMHNGYAVASVRYWNETPSCPTRDEALALAYKIAQVEEMKRFVEMVLDRAKMDLIVGIDTQRRAERILAACEPPKEKTAVEKLVEAVNTYKSEWESANENPFGREANVSGNVGRARIALADALAEYEAEMAEKEASG